VTREELEAALADEPEIVDQDLSGLDLKQLNGSNTKFVNVKFRSADLSVSRFRHSTFERCDFTGARLAGVSAVYVIFSGCIFDGADLSGIYLHQAQFITSVGEACFAGAQLLDTTFDGGAPEIGVTTSDELAPGTRIGPIEVSGEIAAATSNAIYRGVTAIARPTRVLVTIGPRQRRPLSHARANLMYSIDGVAAMVAAVEVTSPSFVRHAVIEELPDGTAIADRAPLSERDAITVLAQLAMITANAHANGWTIAGIHPRLCFIDGTRVTAIAARAMRFLVGMPTMRDGLCLEPYLPHDVWRGDEIEPSDDVFALCALGHFLVTGQSPFAAPTFDEQLAVLATGTFPRLPGPLGHVLARGLVRERELRASSANILAALQAL
jgi:Pentapeptide repeats (9 copies)